MRAGGEVETLEERLTARFARDFRVYAAECLHLRTKDGRTVPFRFNRTQAELHRVVEDQRRRTGRVRVLSLKCRQPGVSSYFAGRSYWKTTFNRGTRAFVLTQDDDTTGNLFGMVKRFHDNVPDFVRPVTGASNAKELVFSRLDSGYLVSTAGNRTTGRGHTIQVFHGSEVAHWTNAEEHVAGVLQAVPDLPGTEIYLESTARGTGNLFHSMVQAAIEGRGAFELVFTPWFWVEEYVKQPEPDWRPPPEFAEYGALHALTRDQLYWAYCKSLEFTLATGSRPEEVCWLFRQEYPATPEEAFQTAGTNSFIRGDLVAKARRSQTAGTGPIVLGVDVARGGGDMSALIDRQGRRLGGHVCLKLDFGKDTMPLVGRIVSIVRELRQAGQPLKKIVVDATGVGGAVYDRLREQLGDGLVMGIEFGGAAINRDRYANRRAEMADALMRWFMNEPDVGIPDSNELQRDLCAPAWPGPKDVGATQMCRFRSDGALLIESKDNMRKRLKFSPDFFDAAALTFAVDFTEFVEQAPGWVAPVAGPGAWMG